MNIMVLLVKLAIAAVSSGHMQHSCQVRGHRTHRTVTVTLQPIEIISTADPLSGLGTASYAAIDAK